ncbi:S-methyl-5-thioribose-1-phosphate isomerase [Ruegeria lacuscaerulensis]|uniref:S-methyl-5-thioribose-1-phosphate isomerase n=1 Tax=Ruegeria lacuscaerulensis TaxID=55218 RepID=UPI00148097D9|nr:S-methyl-5-thioribose-1-phosphate isomerase [Ruegeria lacuscaerulensis]
MKVGGVHYRSIWRDAQSGAVRIIDQRWLPHEFKVVTLSALEDFEVAIRDMWVRGAPLIGATAAYGMAEAMTRDPSDVNFEHTSTVLNATRPTAVNLAWALARCRATLLPLPPENRADAAWALAQEVFEEDIEINRRIGENGMALIREIAAKKPAGEPVNLLTHCNAGWLATVDWGTATSPMYHAYNEGIPIHVWVDETRPRNQGALTAWELGEHGIPHTYVVDNAGGHLMQRGLVDLVITGTDRTTARGDVCNKIGTYLKALAAHDNGVPFYVALPSPTIDWSLQDGVAEIPIEDRPEAEITRIQGLNQGQIGEVLVTPQGTSGGNPAFDVTPNRLVTGLITERGICDASAQGLAGLFPDKAH